MRQCPLYEYNPPEPTKFCDYVGWNSKNCLTCKHWPNIDATRCNKHNEVANVPPVDWRNSKED